MNLESRWGLMMEPSEFELFVRDELARLGADLESLQVQHSELLPGVDGDYRFDATVRFRALGGADFLVLVECKRHRHPIKREAVQKLWTQMQSVGAQKGFIVATAPFQSGAIQYATKHGVALIQVYEGEMQYRTRSYGDSPRAPWVPTWISWLISEHDSRVRLTLLESTKQLTSVWNKGVAPTTSQPRRIPAPTEAR